MDWSACYQNGETPWEKGAPHPALSSFLSSHQDLFANEPRIFHPGCCFGRDAAVLARVAESITAIDIAVEPIAMAKQLHPAKNIRWEIGDLFTWPEEDCYDLVWEHTCISAIAPSTRSDYARTIHQVLKPGGIFCGIIFLNPDHDPDQGPPFHISRAELHDMLDFGFDLLEDLPNPPTYEGREDRETLMIWRKRLS